MGGSDVRTAFGGSLRVIVLNIQEELGWAFRIILEDSEISPDVRGSKGCRDMVYAFSELGRNYLFENLV